VTGIAIVITGTIAIIGTIITITTGKGEERAKARSFLGRTAASAISELTECLEPHCARAPRRRKLASGTSRSREELRQASPRFGHLEAVSWERQFAGGPKH
jgi:hypothetical protein